MRRILIPITMITSLLATLAMPAIGQQAEPLTVTILDAGMVDGHTLRVNIATPELEAQLADPQSLG